LNYVQLLTTIETQPVVVRRAKWIPHFPLFDGLL
jgi:hypothetical protein